MFTMGSSIGRTSSSSLRRKLASSLSIRSSIASISSSSSSSIDSTPRSINPSSSEPSELKVRIRGLCLQIFKNLLLESNELITFLKSLNSFRLSTRKPMSIDGSILLSSKVLTFVVCIVSYNLILISSGMDPSSSRVIHGCGMCGSR